MPEKDLKCFKCGASPAKDGETTLYRFPVAGTLRAELWGKYCFPNERISYKFLKKIHSKHTMLCHRHFDKSAFADYSARKLLRNSFPSDHCDKEQKLDVTGDAALILAVKEYEELYNTQHVNYMNRPVCDLIWDKVGEKLGQNGKICKLKWDILREDFRNVLNSRKVMNQPIPAKYKELNFLIPYLNDDEKNDESPLPEDQHVDNLDLDVDCSEESLDTVKRPELKRIYPVKDPSRNVKKEFIKTNCISETEQNFDEDITGLSSGDATVDFFIRMAKTASKFPLHKQLEIKSKLFDIVQAEKDDIDKKNVAMTNKVEYLTDNLVQKYEDAEPYVGEYVQLNITAIENGKYVATLEPNQTNSLSVIDEDDHVEEPLFLLFNK